jgi:hypothetical protein
MVLLQQQYKKKERAHIDKLRFEYKFGFKDRNFSAPDLVLRGILLLNSSYSGEKS